MKTIISNVNSTSARAMAEILATPYTCTSEYTIGYEPAAVSIIEVEPYSVDANANTKLSVTLAEESASITLIRNGKVDGNCQKAFNASKQTQQDRNALITQEVLIDTCRMYTPLSLVTTILVFNDAKDELGNFKNTVVCYGQKNDGELVSVVDWSVLTNDNYEDAHVHQVDSPEVMWYLKKQMEFDKDGNTYILITDRQRTTFEWIVVANHEEIMDIDVSVYNGLALSSLTLNGDFTMEFRDQQYELQLNCR